MAIRDNRQFIEALKKTGDVVIVDQEVDWDREAGAMARRINETGSPAALMENVKDYPGQKLFASPLATFRRLAVGLELPPDMHIRDLQAEFLKRLNSPINPVIVAKKGAPCKENIITGDDVNLFDLAGAMVHDGDGGRYIGTYLTIIQRDPDTGFHNWGGYRQMIYNKNHLCGVMVPYSDGGRIFDKYRDKGEPCPFATAISMDPACMMTSFIMTPPGFPEANVAGGLAQAPIELVPSENYPDLLVPAHAEVIIEGEIIPDSMITEGPFGEYSGFRSGVRQPRNNYLVKTITYRNNPMLGIACMGMPVDDCGVVSGLGFSVEYLNQLRAARVPVVDVYMPPEGACHLIIVSVEPRFNNIASMVGSVLATPMPMSYTVVVDANEVDPFDLDMVWHAVATRCHPERGVIIRDREVAHPLFPYLNPDEKAHGRGARVIFDTVFPLEWSKKCFTPLKNSFDNIYPKDIQEKVLANWRNYGFKG